MIGVAEGIDSLNAATASGIAHLPGHLYFEVQGNAISLDLA